MQHIRKQWNGVHSAIFVSAIFVLFRVWWIYGLKGIGHLKSCQDLGIDGWRIPLGMSIFEVLSYPRVSNLKRCPILFNEYNIAQRPLRSQIETEGVIIGEYTVM